MRTLNEIIRICKDGGKPTIDEARLAVCVLDALLTFETMRLMRQAEKDDIALLYYQESFRRIQNALAKSPREYLGPEYDPDRPEVQQRRKLSKKIVSQFLGKESRETLKRVSRAINEKAKRNFGKIRTMEVNNENYRNNWRAQR